MLKKVVLLFIMAAGAFAQGTVGAVPLPDSWIGAGAGYSRDTSPKTNGWISYAKLIPPSALIPMQQTYSYNSYDVVRVGKTVTTSLRTGIAQLVRQKQIGKVSLFLFGFGQAGVATTSTSVTSSFAGGGMGFVKFGQSKTTIEAGVRIQKMGSANVNVYEVGLGHTF